MFQNCIPSHSHIWCCSGRSTDVCNWTLSLAKILFIWFPYPQYPTANEVCFLPWTNKSEGSSLACSCQLPLKIELNKQNRAALKISNKHHHHSSPGQDTQTQDLLPNKVVLPRRDCSWKLLKTDTTTTAKSESFYYVSSIVKKRSSQQKKKHIGAWVKIASK